MANNTKLIIMSVLMVVTGSLNTVFVKLADMQTSENSVGDTEGSGVFFNHPFLQAASMFLGEMLCIITFILLKFTGRLDEDTNEEGKKFHPIKHGYIFLLPALCDMCATSLMYVGLNFTPASHFQIFRGSLIIFTGLLRVVWLRKGLEWYKWLGMVVILAGLGVVAVGSFPPFAEEICNSYNVTDQSPMAPSFTTGTFGISISNTDTSLACSDSNTASAKAMDVFKAMVREATVINCHTFMQSIFKDTNPLEPVLGEKHPHAREYWARLKARRSFESTFRPKPRSPGLEELQSSFAKFRKQVADQGLVAAFGLGRAGAGRLPGGDPGHLFRDGCGRAHH